MILFPSSSKQYMQWYGRVRLENEAMNFYYTASGMTCSVQGTWVKFVFHVSYEEDVKKPYIVIRKDCNRSSDQTFPLINEIETIQINLDHQPQVIEVFKRSEALMSKTSLVSIETDGQFLIQKPKSKALAIEWIGDSLTCGYGNLSDNPNIPFSTEYEDGMSSFAVLASETLNAAYEIVAVSGIGLYKSIYASVTLPSIYEQYDINDNHPYPFDYPMDLIVVNLGSNDNSYMQFLESKTRLYEQQKFLLDYNRFLSRLKEIHPDTPILCISQGINKQMHVDELIEKAVNDRHDHWITHFRVSDVKDNEKVGQQYHPVVETHIRWAKELAAHIKTLKGKYHK